MKNKEGEFVYIDDNGGEWVQYEYFKRINAIALESRLIIEHIQMLLGVYTTTAALARIVELQSSNPPNTVCTGQVADASASPLSSVPENQPVKTAGDKPAATCR